MNEFDAARQRYLNRVEKVSRSKGMTTGEYLAAHTALAMPEQSAEDKGEVLLPDMLANLPQPEPVSSLPASDAIIEVTIREPKGEYKVRLEVPQIGDVLSANLRNAAGYKQTMIRALLYALYGKVE